MNLMGTAAATSVVPVPGDAIPATPSPTKKAANRPIERHINALARQEIRRRPPNNPICSRDRASSDREHFLLQKTPVNHSSLNKAGFGGWKPSRSVTSSSSSSSLKLTVVKGIFRVVFCFVC